MKNGQLARAVCFQESADEGNADYISISLAVGYRFVSILIAKTEVF